MCESSVSFTCGDCTTLNRATYSAEYPDSCLTLAVDREELQKIIRIYQEAPVAAPYSATAADSAPSSSAKFKHAEEIGAYAKTLGAQKIGVISCSGLAKETRHFISYLKEEGIASYCVICKVGAVAKEGEIGLPESVKTKDRPHDSICNPVLQAYILEREKTDLNVIIGLCIDHDSLFIRHSTAPVAHLKGTYNQ